jgi:hypothetical protein
MYPGLSKIKKISTNVIQVTIALGILYSLAILTVKLSVLFLYRRIFTINSSWFRFGWWANFLYLMPCFTIVTFTLLGLQLNPHTTAFKNNKLTTIGSPLVGGLNALSDLTVWCLPVTVVARLQLRRREKLAVIGLFSLGIM